MLRWDGRYLYEAQGNLRRAMEELEAQPHDTVCDQAQLREPQPTRVGTAIVGTGGFNDPRRLPDILANHLSELPDMLSKPHGYLVEVATTVAGRPPDPVAVTGGIIRLLELLPPDLQDRTTVVVVGRYFDRKDARHEKHRPTQRLLRLKRLTSAENEPVVGPLKTMLYWVSAVKPVDLVTAVPPKPSSNSGLGLGNACELACESIIPPIRSAQALSDAWWTFLPRSVPGPSRPAPRTPGGSSPPPLRPEYGTPWRWTTS